MKTGRQTSARISRGYCCARDMNLKPAPAGKLLPARRGRRQLWCWDVDRFVRSGQLDEPGVAVGLGDMQLRGVGRPFVDPQIDRIRELGLDRGPDERTQLLSAHFSLEMERVLVLHLLL